MKKILVFILFNLFVTASIFAQEFKTVRDGVEYAEMTREINKAPVRMNLLRLDLTKVRLDVVHALDSAIGLERTSSMATRYGALAAVNAGFFRLDTSIFAGDAAGVLKIDGKLLSESRDNRIALFISNKPDKTEVNFFHLTTWGQVMTKTGECGSEITGVNRERKENDFVLYTPEFNRTTLTNPNGLEIVFRNRKVVQVVDGKGSILIPPDGFVLSASGKYRDEVKKCRVGTKIWELQFTDYDSRDSRTRFTRADFPRLETFTNSEDITNGVPQLIKDGKIEITWEQEKTNKAFVETRHPRTAVAKLKDGKFLMITVDGRSEASGGIGLEDLAKLFLELGATDAMNLDGGGSTTMFLDGKVVNRPSDKEGERRVSDVILVFPRQK
jgi:hypothetical protein